MSVLTDTFRQLCADAKRHNRVAVAFSGGKDSLAVLDMACKTFKTVRAFYWFTIPDLECCNVWMRFAKERYGVDVVQIPHWRRYNAMRRGMWCDVSEALEGGPDKLSMREAFAYSMDVVGCDWCLTGMKDADGLKRRQFFSNIRDGGDPVWTKIAHPLRHWLKRDVIGYLEANKIPIPKSESGSVTSGVGLDHSSLCWLHDNHPQDFEKLLQWFPYAGAAIKRREWFGVAPKWEE